MKVRIEIDTKTFIRFWLVVIGFISVIWMMFLAQTGLIIIGTGLFLALALSAPVSAIRRRIPGLSRGLATATAFTAVVLFLLMFIILVIPPIIDQTLKIVERVPEIVETLAGRSDNVEAVIEKYSLQPEIDKAVLNIREQATSWFAGLGAGIFAGIGSLFGLFAALFLTLVLAFLILVEGPTWLQRLWNLYKDEERMETHQRIVGRMHHAVSGYVTGQLTVSGIGALATGFVVFLLGLVFPGVDTNLALPAIAIGFLFSLIPMFGSTIAGIIIGALLIISSLPATIIFVIFFVIYQQVENNLISPAIQSKYLQLSPLAVLVAVTIGIYMFGIVGGIISIPIAGVIKVLVEEYLVYTNKKRKESTTPINKVLKKIQGDS